MSTKAAAEPVTKYADMMSAMGTEPRLRIMRLLLSAHPNGLVVGPPGVPVSGMLLAQQGS